MSVFTTFSNIFSKKSIYERLSGRRVPECIILESLQEFLKISEQIFVNFYSGHLSAEFQKVHHAKDHFFRILKNSKTSYQQNFDFSKSEMLIYDKKHQIYVSLNLTLRRLSASLR